MRADIAVTTYKQARARASAGRPPTFVLLTRLAGVRAGLVVRSRTIGVAR